ncbi:unnamed protein product [Musa textilis]
MKVKHLTLFLLMPSALLAEDMTRVVTCRNDMKKRDKYIILLSSSLGSSKRYYFHIKITLVKALLFSPSASLSSHLVSLSFKATYPIVSLVACARSMALC